MDDNNGFKINRVTLDQFKADLQGADQNTKEQEQYMAERANADNVQYNTMREDAYNNRVNTTLDSLKTENSNEQVGSTYYNPIYSEERANSLLNSVQDNNYRAEQEKENQILDNERSRIQTSVDNRNINYFEDLRMQFELIRQQHEETVEKEVEPTVAQKIKEKAKKALPYIVAGAIAVGTIAGAYNVFTQPEITPSENDFHPNSVEDVIEYRDQQVENGITTHPEHVINDNENSEEVNSESDSLSSSMQEFVERENREKVIKIESGYEHVIDDSVTRGGRN